MYYILSPLRFSLLFYLALNEEGENRPDAEGVPQTHTHTGHALLLCLRVRGRVLLTLDTRFLPYSKEERGKKSYVSDLNADKPPQKHWEEAFSVLCSTERMDKSQTTHIEGLFLLTLRFFPLRGTRQQKTKQQTIFYFYFYYHETLQDNYIAYVL